MKIKTQDLIGAALDWAVAKASERLGAWRRDELRPGTSILDIGFDEHGELCEYIPGSRRDPYKPWKPSTDWSQGGPIIERKRINLTFCAGFWRATRDDRPTSGEHAEEDGPTALIAAMRCVVASELGDEVDVPEEVL